MSARLKINPNMLPYRGEPTREVRIGEVVPDNQVLGYSSPLGRFPTAEERKAKGMDVKRKPRCDAWTPEQDSKILRMFYEEKKTKSQIGEAMGRTKDAIGNRLRKLKRGG